jgi:hypothetical protein
MGLSSPWLSLRSFPDEYLRSCNGFLGRRKEREDDRERKEERREREGFSILSLSFLEENAKK